MISYCEEFFTKKFCSDNMKSVFLNASKWVATNVISKAELHNVKVEYEKKKDQFPTIVVHLFATISSEEVKERHCEICKEMHNKFFINENCNCAWCNSMAFERRAEQIMQTKLGFYRDKMKGV